MNFIQTPFVSGQFAHFLLIILLNSGSFREGMLKCQVGDILRLDSVCKLRNTGAWFLIIIGCILDLFFVQWNCLREKSKFLKMTDALGRRKYTPTLLDFMSLQLSPSSKASMYSFITLADCDCSAWLLCMNACFALMYKSKQTPNSFSSL